MEEDSRIWEAMEASAASEELEELEEAAKQKGVVEQEGKG